MYKNKVLIINEGYSDNLGDQAINDSLQYLLKSNYDAEIMFQDFTRNSKRPKDIVNSQGITNKLSKLLKKFYRVIPSKIRWLIENIDRVRSVSKDKYDLVIIGGGQLILSNSTFAIAMSLWVFFLNFFGNKNIVLFAVGSGIKFRFIDKLLYKYTFNKVSKIYVRDYKSQKVLKELFNVNADFVYDVAFIYNKILTTNFSEKENILLGVISLAVYKAYNKKIAKEQFFESWIKLLEGNDIPLNKVKLFYTTKDDRQASLEFKEYVFKNYDILLELLETRTKNLLIEELAKARLIISARMHALILGLTYNCETITYPVSDKLREFDKMFNSKFDLEEVQDNIETKIKELL